MKDGPRVALTSDEVRWIMQERKRAGDELVDKLYDGLWTKAYLPPGFVSTPLCFGRNRDGSVSCGVRVKIAGEKKPYIRRLRTPQNLNKGPRYPSMYRS